MYITAGIALHMGFLYNLFNFIFDFHMSLCENIVKFLLRQVGISQNFNLGGNIWFLPSRTSEIIDQVDNLT